MKTMMAKMSMQKRMMIYFAVPLLIIQAAVAAVFYPALLDRFKSQLNYSVEQSINQALSFVGSYLHSMEYLTEMVENNREVYEIISARDFTGRRKLEEHFSLTETRKGNPLLYMCQMS